LLKMGRYQEACDAYRGELSYALFSNLEANAEVLSLLRPFFPKGWAFLPGGVDGDDGSYLANDAALALSRVGEGDQSLAAYGAALAADVRAAKWNELCSGLSNICGTLDEQNRLALAQRFREWNLDLAVLIADRGQVFRLRLDLFAQLAKSGKWDAAQAMWDLLDPMGRHWNRAVYRPGYAEFWYATFRFWRGDLSEELLSQAERLAKAGKDRALIRHLHWLRGEWHMERGEWELAAESLREAVSMARAVGRTGASAETLLALARFRLGELDDPRREAEQLASATPVSHRRLSELWLAIRDSEQAKKHALAAYKRAWADGEPYVRRYELNKARALLETLGVEIPDLPAYDPAREEKFPWEDDVVAAIAKLRAEKEAEGDGG